MRFFQSIAILFIMASFVYGDKIVISSDIWCPVNCKAGSGQEGFMVDIARTVFEKAGHEVEYRNIPWNRTVVWVREGSINGAIGPYFDDCPDFVFPENEQAMISFEMFVKKQNPWIYKGVSSLAKVRLGIIAEYSYGKELDAHLEKGKFSKAMVQTNFGKTPLRNNILKLMEGRLDAVVATGPVFWYTANKLKVVDQLKSAGFVTRPQKAYVAFSPALPASKTYARILSDGMEQLRKTGELEKILSRYSLTDWRKTQ